jgi:DNA topoisomerase-1
MTRELILTGGSYKWTTLEHNGILFPAEYEPHNIPLKFSDKFVKLKSKEEECAMLYAKYIKSEYILNKTFNKNFWNDWKKILGKTHEITNLEQCDFTEYYNKILLDKQIQKNIIVTFKGDDDIENNINRLSYNITKDDEDKYKTALVDGIIQPVGNYKMEPPGIFLGRGNNPKIGKIKPRIYPEDVTLNIGKEAPIPKTLDGHKWGKIIHDRHVEWLCSWKDMITGKIKYLWLGAHSNFKITSDTEKFDLARKLKKKIDYIRSENQKNLLNDNIKIKQIATAFYFIDKFALRVGGEKGEDTADTVGVTTLRKEHVKLLENNVIELDFLGKDSVRYYNKLEVDDIIFKNVRFFLENKNNNEELFDSINSNDVNKYLQEYMKDLTAKVFRTYNASYLFQKEIKKIYTKYDNNTDINILIDEYNKANAFIAKKLNHQKNIGKNYKDQVDKINEKIKNIKTKIKKEKENNNNKDKIEKLNNKLKKYQSKKELKQELKNVSLGTSKQNYIDPRISVGFIKKYDIPIEKIFNKALQTKFNWALSVDSDYIF